MTQVGAFEAKTHLPKLLEQVRNGASFVITKHGHPVAELIPVRTADSETVRTAIEGLKSFQRGHTLEGLSVRQLIVEGRRY
ncbi:MAG: type II toxin-antitoxin system prevent-host-death family antitoxin [Gammaproteobacteria bacterium]|nr:type II toxin-antitoxin system prevent-host-death family antitoxin [Gammaproteobacteria bacterium]